MKKERWSGIRRRVGPIGLSLVAAAITAVGFAAISVAADDDNKGGSGGDTFEAPAPPPGVHMFRDRLSDEDRQKLGEFRQCMEDQGAPAPPRIEEGSGPPDPPSSEEMEKVRKAHEACEDQLPEELQGRGFPAFGHGPCGPPPGADGERARGSTS